MIMPKSKFKTNNGFSKRLKEERDRLEQTQEGLAQAIGTDKRTISRYESDQYKAPLFEMAREGIDIVYVITGVRMSLKCLLEIQKGLENGDDWKPSRAFIISQIKQHLSYLEEFEEFDEFDGI